LAGAIGLIAIVFARERLYFRQNGTDNILDKTNLSEATDSIEVLESPVAPQSNVLGIDEINVILKEWEIVVQTQMHFNDLIMKVRSATISVVLAVFGAAGYSLQFGNLDLVIASIKFHASVLVITSGLLFLIGMFVLDYFYYFKTLKGAVEKGNEFEKYTIAGHRLFNLNRKISDAISKKRNTSRYTL
jgi:hypothetical protein